MNVYTIGFTQKTAKQFFETLKLSGIRRVLDVRLNNDSQLAGFSKKNDLSYFLEQIGRIEYAHVPVLAPTQDMLDAYKKGKGSWEAYEHRFISLMEERRIEEQLSPELLSEGCLLCSEHLPHQCHRRLVVEYLKKKWGNIEIKHLT